MLCRSVAAAVAADDDRLGIGGVPGEGSKSISKVYKDNQIKGKRALDRRSAPGVTAGGLDRIQYRAGALSYSEGVAADSWQLSSSFPRRESVSPGGELLFGEGLPNRSVGALRRSTFETRQFTGYQPYIAHC
jgi:hypothetical protein